MWVYYPAWFHRWKWPSKGKIWSLSHYLRLRKHYFFRCSSLRDRLKRSISSIKERERILLRRLLIKTSESSIIEQFSLEFTLRRFEGDAPSTIFDAEPVRFAVVGVVATGVFGVSVGIWESIARPERRTVLIHSVREMDCTFFRDQWLFLRHSFSFLFFRSWFIGDLFLFHTRETFFGNENSLKMNPSDRQIFICWE